jgi:hypothetical protein
MTQHDNDGRHDFDFLHGRWHVTNRKLADVSDPACAEWTEFESAAECRPILGGLGNVDTFATAGFDGASLRLFDPITRTWRIWWMSSRQPGVLDPPVEGRFTGNEGLFEGADEFHGKPILVRYEWTLLGDGKAQWAQRFSWDDGSTWDELNWVMTHTRI